MNCNKQIQIPSSQASASCLLFEEDNNSMMSLSHNQLQIIFDSLSFNEILNMRLLNKQMNEQIKHYLREIYIPRHFANFNLEEERASIEQLQKRKLTLNLSAILSQESLKSLSNIMSSHQELVQNIYSCYNILQKDLFVYDKGTNQLILDSEKFQDFCNNFNIDQLSNDTYEQLAEQVQNFSMSVVTPQMRQVAIMVRTFSYLVMNFQFSSKLNSTKLRVSQFQVIENIISKQQRE